MTEEEYGRALAVWDHFKVKTLGEYSDIYLKSDVLQLADAFENFCRMCLTEYRLDCVHYFTAPGLAFDTMLLKTGVELELIMDSDMYMFIEYGIRGGITACVRKHARANNSLVAGYDQGAKNSYLTYVDANNLYGWAMSKPLSSADLRWVPKAELDLDRILRTKDSDPVGYMLEVDLAYPKELHILHNDLPFLPENGVPSGSKDTKLLTTLCNKKKYIRHYVNLKQVVENGLIVTAVHRALRFYQRAWLRPYIELNTENRKRAQNSFEKDFFKLMNNAVFGKTIENVRKRMKIVLVTDTKRLNKLIRRPTYEGRLIYGESLCAVILTPNVRFIETYYVRSQ